MFLYSAAVTPSSAMSELMTRLSFVVLRGREIRHQRPAQRDLHQPPGNHLHRLLRHGTVNYVTHSSYPLRSVDGRLKEFSTDNLHLNFYLAWAELNRSARCPRGLMSLRRQCLML